MQKFQLKNFPFHLQTFMNPKLGKMRTNWDANVFCNKSFSCCTLSSSDVKFSLPPKEAKKKKETKNYKNDSQFFSFLLLVWVPCWSYFSVTFSHYYACNMRVLPYNFKNAVTSVIKLPRKRIGCSEISTFFGSILNSNLFGWCITFFRIWVSLS